MASALTGLNAKRRRARVLAGAIAAVLVGAPSAEAIEFIDGRVQIHGFAEMQLRALDSQFAQEVDLAQWYNVLNLEFEFDIAPDGFGPIDLMSAYVRVEGRYDALYSNGFGLFPSIDTYGDRSYRIPQRIRGAVDTDFSGVIKVVEDTDEFPRSKDGTNADDTQPQRIVPPDSTFPTAEHPNGQAGVKQASPLRPFGERRGFPGFDTFFRQRGGDDVAGWNPDLNPVVDGQPQGRSDDPGDYILFDQTADGSTDILGPDGSIVGVVRNDNVFKFTFNAHGKSRANPFRGRFSPNVPVDRVIVGTSFIGLLNQDYVPGPEGTRFYENDYDDAFGQAIADDPDRRVDPLNPFLRTIAFAPNSVTTALGGATSPLNSFFPRFGSALPKLLSNGVPTTFLLNSFFGGYGGDFSGIVPCGDPVTAGGTGENQRLLKGEAQFCVPRSAEGGFVPGGGGQPIDPNGLVTVQENLRIIGGVLENPFRPAPDISNLVTDENQDNLVAQGIYYPSVGLRNELRQDTLNSIGSVFNIDQRDRSWNRGAAQRFNKELKEAYFDIEVMDSRLWMRLGLQNIVWGKTELFRTTDQFNPQDLALASLPSLEESRVALWSARFVYSLYSVGPLEDVRAEFAFNFDHVQPADLGACGEPFTPDVVCGVTTGFWAHDALGVGIAGVDNPPDPWQDISGLEVGGRIEWRWDRFSFAVTDFYGYDDFPYPDAIFFYERNVDPYTGRPLIARSPQDALGVYGRCAAPATTADQVGPNPLTTASPADPVNHYNTTYASHPLSVTATGAVATVAALLPEFVQYRGGLGRDPDCLRPGAAPGGVSAFSTPDDPTRTTDSYNVVDPVTGEVTNVPVSLADTYALANHHANQQAFAWICSATTGIAATLDATSCAWTVFASPVPFTTTGGNQDRFSELLAAILAGEPSGTGSEGFLQTVVTNTKGSPSTAFQVFRPVPLASLNMLFNDPNAAPGSPGYWDVNQDGVINRLGSAACNGQDPNAYCDLQGFDGIDGRSLNMRTRPDAGYAQFVTLDKSLTNEQRSLLGCGPFWGIRCDSSVNGPLTNPQRGVANGTKGGLWYAQVGGLDFLNMEASALVQAWPGFDGTPENNTVASTVPQPGTVNFVGGPICTRFVEGVGAIKLPGCRGVKHLWVVHDDAGAPVGVNVEFDVGYLPQIDGCVLGHQIDSDVYGQDIPVRIVGQQDPRLAQQLELCSRSRVRKPVPGMVTTPGNPDVCADGSQPVGVPGFSVCDAQTVTLEQLPLIHPLAGCIASAVADPGGGCNSWFRRDLPSDFLAGNGQMFQNELAAFSWNFLVFLTITSCQFNTTDLDGEDHKRPDGADPNDPTPIELDRECYYPAQPYAPDRCSVNAPQFCSNVKGFLSAAGNTARTILAGGNESYGRRTFLWHSGGEVVLRYQRRNVLGFSTDFAEDVSKTNWGVEFTWIDRNNFLDTASPSGITDSGTLNLTLSVDRPTFINFLNPNRTFFFNTQWFFNYIPGYKNTFTFNGPVNVLFTFAFFTGYFQDRLNPQLVSVFDFNSRSGGLLPSLQYRFTESFSATIGINWFFGRTELVDVPVRGFAPDANQAGQNAYRAGVDNLLSLIRRRDEVYLRIRWTF
jgi:hypothetical protein